MSMNIDDLRTQNSGAATSPVEVQQGNIVNINLKLSAEEREELLRKRMENKPDNIDEEVLATAQGEDLGNGIREFVPETLGIFNKPQEVEKDDAMKALEIFDKEIFPQKVEEMEQFNAALDVAGELTEEEVLQMQGKDYITKVVEEPRRLGALKTIDLTDEDVKAKELKQKEIWERIDAERSQDIDPSSDSQKSYEKEMGIDLDNLNLPYAPEEVEAMPNPTMDDEDASITYKTEQTELVIKGDSVVMETSHSKTIKATQFEDATGIVDNVTIVGGLTKSADESTTFSTEYTGHDGVNEGFIGKFVNTGVTGNIGSWDLPSEDTDTTNVTENTSNEEIDESDDDFVLPESQIIEDVSPYNEFANDDDEDLKEDKESEDLENIDGKETDEEIMNRFKKSIKEKIKPVTKAFDISTYTVVNKAVPFSNAVQSQTTHFRSAKWALMNSGRPITMRSFLATEFDAISNGSRGDTRYMTVKKQYKMIFDHIMDPKPKTVEEWAKVNSFLDLDHIWFSVYRASFEGSNYIPKDCVDTTKCRNVFLTEDIPLMDMVKFESKEVRKEFFNILNKEADMTSNMYVSEVVPISNDYAIALREPSIYNIVFETALLEEDFLNSHQDLVSVLAYIDQVYKLDHTTRSMVPINSPYFANNETKTYKTRIKTLSKILDTLTSDQYRYILTLIDNINKRGDKVTYIHPEMTCPKCNTKIPEAVQTPQNMVFLRHQLVNFAI
ncbi:MAG: hypothetical protein PHC62_00615 [Candidatus Izemoplasmatales bacterium]|nr:hypothetical protein [Candidatus Izemoplasmatales bacterium]